MIVLSRKISIFSVFECWNNLFPYSVSPFSFCIFHHVRKERTPPSFLLKIKYVILEIDLKIPAEMIFGRFNKQVRNSIRSAERLGIICEETRNYDMFRDYFNLFADQKGIPRLQKYLFDQLDGNLFISIAQHNGKILCAHCYLVDHEEKYAILFRSASSRYLDAALDGNLVGKANKLLHFRDMVALKERGIETYEFGGYDERRGRHRMAGINSFKSRFGGSVNHHFRYITFPYFLIRKTKDLLFYN